jgi:hypothetical protein
MKTYFIYPKKYLGSNFEKQFIDYSKKDAIKLYRDEFPQFLLKELNISKKPYINL